MSNNYIKNQMELLELIIERKIRNDEMPEIFQFIEDVYNDGLADKQSENNDALNRQDIEERIEKREKKAKKKTGPGQAADLGTFI